jgi:hypothetical protein
VIVGMTDTAWPSGSVKLCATAAAVVGQRATAYHYCDANEGMRGDSLAREVRLVGDAIERQFKHPGQAFVITVPGNESKELAPGTLNAILNKAGLK